MSFGLPRSKIEVKEDKKAGEETCDYGGGRWTGAILALFCPIFWVLSNGTNLGTGKKKNKKRRGVGWSCTRYIGS